MQKSFYLKGIKPDINFNFLLSTPKDFSLKESLPLIVFLHGSGERGEDLELLKTHSIPVIFNDTSPVRAITLCPQLEGENVWNTCVKELKLLIDYIVKTYNINTRKISLTGLSMGGYGVWELAMAYPNLFCALAPICGGGMAWRAYTIKHIPVKAFHGDLDDAVKPSHSFEMVDAINKLGGNADLTIFHNVGHDSWNKAYLETNLLQWLCDCALPIET